MSKTTNDESLFDVRVLDHRLRRGDISREQYEAFLAKLPDDADAGTGTETVFTTPYAERHHTGSSRTQPADDPSASD